MTKRATQDYDYDQIRAFLEAHPGDELKVVGYKLGIPTKAVWRVFQLDARKEDPDYAPRTKTSLILKYMQAHPRCGNLRIAEVIGASRALVNDTRRLWKDLIEDPITAPHYAPVKPAKRCIESAPMYRVLQSELESNPIYRAQQPKSEPVACEGNTIEQVLVERGKDYGDYASKAQFIQGVKYLMRSSPSWEAMDADMRESMEMIAHKMGRVVYGDPTHKDNFLDIAGYAKLVADRLQDNAN
jgi:hypothetical protein